MPDTSMRAVEHAGEVYICRADLLEIIDQTVRHMSDPEPKAVIKHFVGWLIEATRSVE